MIGSSGTVANPKRPPVGLVVAVSAALVPPDNEPPDLVLRSLTELDACDDVDGVGMLAMLEEASEKLAMALARPRRLSGASTSG